MAAPCAEIKFLQFQETGGPVFCVDGFQFADKAKTEHYFLSHFHADHTVGLRKSFSAGLIYCSQVTGRLVKEFIQVDADRVRELPMEEPVELEGVRVTLVDANHCPGAVVFLFHHLATGRTVVHTGDVRAADCVRTALQRQLQAQKLPHVHELFLDTTYASTRWELPDQPEVLRELSELCRREAERDPRTLFVVGAYQIGKEKAAAAIGRSVGSSVWAGSRRFQMLQACGWTDEVLPSEKKLFTTDSAGCSVRLDGMMALTHERLLSTLEHSKGGFSCVCAFRPTGWTFSKSWRKFRPWVENEGKTKVFSVPYSEHSSVSELRALVSVLRPQKVVPTVNIERCAQMLDMFAPGMDLSEDRARMDWYLGGKARDEGPQLINVLQLSGAAVTVCDDVEEMHCGGGSSSSSSGSCARRTPAGVGEDLSCVDVAAQQRLLDFYSKQRQGGGPGKAAPKKQAWTWASKAKDKAKAAGKGKGKAWGKGKGKSEAPPLPKTPAKREAGQPPATPRKRRARGPAAEEGEGRGKRFIPKPSAQVRERIDRAYSHRMYLLAVRPGPVDAPEGPSASLEVLGSTGNVYRVRLGRPCQSCSCADFEKQPNRVCKHILFVMLRVCRLAQDDPRVWQAALTAEEARPLVAALPSREELASQGDGVVAESAVLRGFDAARGAVGEAERRPVEGDCPICFEPLAEAGGAISWCRSCGHNAHEDCVRRWHKARDGASCPLCRGLWHASGNAEGPLNLASLATEAAPSLEELYPETYQWMVGGPRSRWRGLQQPEEPPSPQRSRWRGLQLPPEEPLLVQAIEQQEALSPQRSHWHSGELQVPPEEPSPLLASAEQQLQAPHGDWQEPLAPPAEQEAARVLWPRGRLSEGQDGVVDLG